MAGRPPEDDDALDPILSQVSDALSALGLGDEGTRADVIEGVRDALRSLGDALGPPVVLFDEDDPSEEAEGPDLRVVDTEEVERFQQRQQGTEIHILKGAYAKSSPLPAEGQIRVAWEDGERPWQTVYRGESAQPYRLSCDRGQLELSVDGMGLDRIVEGQTMDLEARVIRLRAAAGADAQGRYVRLA